MKKLKAFAGIWRHLIIPTGVFLGSAIILLIFRNFLDIQLLLFEEIVLVILFAAIIFIIRLKFLATSLCFSTGMVIQSIVIGVLFSTILLTNTLLNIDRSRSFYVLSWVQQDLVSLDGNRLRVTANSNEAADLPGIEMRLKEQEDRGLISTNSGRYSLTYRGKVVLDIANILGNWFRLDNWSRNRI